MPLSNGTRLGPYEIVSPLGAGGMGEVYRARDTRLDRTVAVKVLPAHVASLPEVRQRFEREARAVSALNHPHICTLHDIGSQDGIDFLVMEYLEGETLAERLKKGPLPREEALRYAIQITDALHKAHRQGIVHRDLKPGNIMLTPGGVKILDFGLAKMQERGAVTSGGSIVQTLTTPLTGAGSIVGTLQYMAPEQLEGKDADARSDIFSFGAVFYEMLAGARLFEAKSQAGVIAAILERDPGAISLNHPALERMLRVCLAKDPDERYQSARDLNRDLQWIAAGGEPAAALETVAPRRAWLPWAVAALCLAGAAALGVIHFRGAKPETEPVRFTIGPPEQTRIATMAPAISPNGRYVAFCAVGGALGKRALWLRPLDAVEARMIPGTEDATYPFWSPDSRSIAFFGLRKLMRVEAAGGTPQAVCDTSSANAHGGAWSTDGTILFVRGNSPISRVSAAGGSAQPATTLAGGEIAHYWPVFLPDGRHFLYLVTGTRSGISAGSLDSKETQFLTGAESGALFAPRQPGATDGHLLVLRQGVVRVFPFDAARLRIAADSVATMDDVGGDPRYLHMFLGVSGNGIAAFRKGTTSRNQLMWMDRAGKIVGDPLEFKDSMAHAEISPDGKRVSADVGSTQLNSRDVWIHEMARSTTSRFTFHSGLTWCSAWSPDGAWISYVSDQDAPAGTFRLYRKLATGAGTEELLLDLKTYIHHQHWHPNGKIIAFDMRNAQTKGDVWILPLEGDRKPYPFMNTPFNEAQPQFSPDGHWLAYISDESGRFEVYVQSFPAGKGKWQISTAGGVQARWNRNGKEMDYLAADGKIMAVDLRATADSFEAGNPKPLFETSLRGTETTAHYAAMPDGSRFLVQVPARDEISSPITVVMNWAAGLKR